MKKEDKGVIISQLAETVKEFGHFYLVDVTALNAEKTAQLRRKCFEAGIKLVVVKNSLLHKALKSAVYLRIPRIWFLLPPSSSHTLVCHHCTWLETELTIADKVGPRLNTAEYHFPLLSMKIVLVQSSITLDFKFQSKLTWFMPPSNRELQTFSLSFY